VRGEKVLVHLLARQPIEKGLVVARKEEYVPAKELVQEPVNKWMTERPVLVFANRLHGVGSSTLRAPPYPEIVCTSID
jgi:hypothetical protein